ncbi:retrovirus-related Pol polyprotein from transposon 412 [Trichonephila clavipes]|nr:retrovirus-related Pol polyprotein from transposon 412 [Trichonephila clavipes]
MKELSNGQLQDDFLQSLWLQRMPPHIQTVLSASSEPLDKLAIIADKVSEVVGASSTICAATTVPPPSQSSSCSVQPTMDSLARQIQELSLQVAELTRERNSSRHQQYSSDRRRSHSRSRSVNRGSGICYYHRRYKSRSATYGMVRKELNLGLRRPFIWTFIIADVSSPIIGADFLKHFNLLIDLKKKSNPSLISKSASHGTVHHIITTGPPVTARPRRLHPKLYDAVKVEFEFLLAQGIIRPSKSPWSSPLHVVPKSDSTVRPVGDYRQLNSVTEFDSYPMPYLNDFAHALHGGVSKLWTLSYSHWLSFPQNLLRLKSLTVPTTVNSLLSTRLSDTFGICWKLEISQCLLTTSPSLMLLGKKSDKCSPWQIRQLDFISQFTTNIVHIPGPDNIAADVLSRVSAINFPSQIDYDCIAETQHTDQELHTLCPNIDHERALVCAHLY